MGNRIIEKLAFCQNFAEQKKLHLTLVLAVSATIVFYNLGQNSFHNGDEASHALMIKDILTTGSWATLKIQGENVFFKPPLMIWLGALSSKAFGFSEFSVRFPSAMFGLLTIFFTYLFADQIFDRKIALLSSLIVMTCTQFVFVHASKTGEFDTAITFFTLLSLYLIWKSKHKKIFFYLSFSSIGIAAMIKSVVFVIPFVVLLFHLLSSGRIRDFNMKEWAMAIGLFLIIALPWHINQLIIHGHAFIDLYVMDQIIGRRIGTGAPIGLSNPLFYINVIARGFFPWSIVLPFALIYNTLYIRKESKEQTLLLLFWIFVVFAICNTITSKYNYSILQNWYILPIYPALAILNARLLIDIVTDFPNKKVFSFTLIGIFFAVILIYPDKTYNPFEGQAFKSLMRVTFNDVFSSYYHKNAGLAFLVVVFMWLLLSSLIYLIFSNTNKKYQAVSNKIVSVLVICFLLYSFFLILRPIRFSNNKSEFYRMNNKIWSTANAETVLVFFGNNLPFYQDYIYFHNFRYPHRTTLRYIGLDKGFLRQELLSHNNKIFLMERQHYYDIRSKDEFQGILPQSTTELSNYVLLADSEIAIPVEDRRNLVFNAIEGLKDNNPEVKKVAARNLGRLGDQLAVSPLIGLLGDSDGGVVSAAAKALGDLRDTIAVDPLKKTLRRYHANEEPFQTIALALAYLRDKTSTNFLANLYRKDPLYAFKGPTPINSQEYRNHNNIWTAYLLLNIDPVAGRDLISEDLDYFVNTLKSYDATLTIYNRMYYKIYRIGNETVLNLIKKLLTDEDIAKRKIAIYLLAKPPSLITRMTEDEMDLAKALLYRAHEADHSTELRATAGKILKRYHKEAWIGW
jgi:HEAT repeat protein